MSRKDRLKAQDVFNQTNYVFAKKGSFEEAYPSIESIEVKVIESGHDIFEWNQERNYNKSNLGEFINCSFSLCYNGGFQIDTIISDMVKNNLDFIEENKPCQGYEGSPKGFRRYRSCINRFQITVKIKYKE